MSPPATRPEAMARSSLVQLVLRPAAEKRGKLGIETFEQLRQRPPAIDTLTHLVRTAEQIDGWDVLHEFVRLGSPGEPLPSQLVCCLNHRHPSQQGSKGASVAHMEHGS